MMPVFRPPTSSTKAGGSPPSSMRSSSRCTGHRGRASCAKRLPDSTTSPMSPALRNLPQGDPHPPSPLGLVPPLPRCGAVRERVPSAARRVRGVLQDPVVEKIVAHVERVAEHAVPEAARSEAKTFIADTLAVGIAGRGTPWRGEILDMLAGIGGAEEATVFGGGERLPLVHAAMLNAYQIHAQEFDCVHEAAVVHPMAAALPALLGWAERDGGVSGARLIRALVVAVDV